MATEEKMERLEFRGGMLGLFMPFVIMLAGILYLSISGKALPMAFWVPTLAGIAAALALAKKPAQCAEALIEGIANKTVICCISLRIHIRTNTPAPIKELIIRHLLRHQRK